MIEVDGQWVIPDQQDIDSRVFQSWDIARTDRNVSGLPTITFYFDEMPCRDSWAYLTHPTPSPWPAFQEGDRGRLDVMMKTIEFIVTKIYEHHLGGWAVEAQATRIQHSPAAT